MQNFVCSWSGGKDSCYALHLAVTNGMQPLVLLNVLNEYGDRSRSHGIPKEILVAQSESLGIPIRFFESTWEQYEKRYIEKLQRIVEMYPIDTAVFGDIDIEPHRLWEEKVSNAANVKAVLPLWKQNRKQLVLKMIETGIEAIVVSCNEQLGPEFLGRQIDIDLINDLEEIGIDVCGENGEYHTLVTNSPLFKNRIEVAVTDKQKSSDYNFALVTLV